MGSSLAYNLAADGFSGNIAVFEKDPSYERATTTLGAGGIRRQFSTAVNIRLSQYSLSIYERFGELMEVDGDRPEVDFRRRGYLFLGSQKNWHLLEKHQSLQREQGADTILLSLEETIKLIPDLNPEGLVGSSYSPRDGYLDPYSALRGFIRKAKSLRVTYIYDEVTEIVREGGRITGIRTKKGESYNSPVAVNAAGPYASLVGEMAGLSLPVVPVRRMAYLFHPPRPFDYDLPLVIDPSGLYFRHESGKAILTGKSRADEPPGFNFEWDREYFLEEIWPQIALRVPLFNELKLIRGWAGLYEVNQWDYNGIIGACAEPAGFYLAVGFSGHGFQQAPAVGKALGELIRLNRYETIDVSDLSFDRIARGRKILEEEVV